MEPLVIAPPTAPWSRVTEELISKPDLPRSGMTLAGKYLLREEIGAGGMGVVFDGVHIALSQRVAIKFLHPDIAGRPEAMARFLREARSAAQIRGDHAVRIFDVDKTEQGAPYIVMELLEGVSLESLLVRRGPLPVEEAVDFVLQAAEAIAEAHAAGIVHRDLKPANLFLTDKSNGSALIKVLDFGISKSLDKAEKDGHSTAPNVPLGSPDYMSPEQVRHAASVDERTDIWSMGVILYELLTGKLPFLAESIPHLFALIIASDPVPLKTAAPAVPDELARVVHRCLQRDPADRYASVLELAHAIAPFGPPHAPVLVGRIRRASGGAVDSAPAASSGRSAPASANLSATQSAFRKSTVPPAPARIWRPQLWQVALILATAGISLFLAMRSPSNLNSSAAHSNSAAESQAPALPTESTTGSLIVAPSADAAVPAPPSAAVTAAATAVVASPGKRPAPQTSANATPTTQAPPTSTAASPKAPKNIDDLNLLQ
jgi:serine/threonine-protein kinase